MRDHGHIPVLPRSILNALTPCVGETYVDATAGLGGHGALFAEHLAPRGRVLLNDVDPGNLERAAARVGDVGRGDGAVEVRTLLGNFADLGWRMAEAGLSADILLADLGFSSNQMDDGARGFSFMREGPLDMRLDPAMPVTAAELVNSLPVSELTRILKEFGEEKAASRIARKIAQARAEAPITTTTRFADVVRSALGPKQPGVKTDPATRSFQAIRIAVNDELGALDALLASIAKGAHAVRRGAAGWLKPGARIGIISFHSLEDRAVKRAFGDLVRDGLAESLTDGPVEAGPDEVSENPRARSAKFRAVRLAGVTDVPRSLS